MILDVFSVSFKLRSFSCVVPLGWAINNTVMLFVIKSLFENYAKLSRNSKRSLY